MADLGFGLNGKLGLIELIGDGARGNLLKAPVKTDLFEDLWNLVGKTVAGAKVNRLKPEDSRNGFRVIEVNAETGENLGRLNMLYLKKPIPCYYLVYVEVSAPFRRKGLGTQILNHFKQFLIEKSAVGILDNIIPQEDPSYDIYLKQSWRPIKSIIGNSSINNGCYYMIFIPPRLEVKDLREPVLKLTHHLSRKRTAIDMRDNQAMVRETIAEFKSLYLALLDYFKDEIRNKTLSPLGRFMFTRFVTKLIAFRRRIEDLVGYTGGDSLEQIRLAQEIAVLPMQSYTPFALGSESNFVNGDIKFWDSLPEELKKYPARTIEALPDYQRPSLVAWITEKGFDGSHSLTIGDLMDLGFDPSRLKEININDQNFIFERIQVKQLPDLEKKKALLDKIGSKMPGARVKDACLKVNSPLLMIRDRGNGYVLRRKIGGIHWEEAVEQLQTSPHLKAINVPLKFDRIITTTVREAIEAVARQLNSEEDKLLEQLTVFVSWNLKKNTPKTMIDFTTTALESVWLA